MDMPYRIYGSHMYMKRKSRIQRSLRNEGEEENIPWLSCSDGRFLFAQATRKEITATTRLK